jgi:hypothetical protein
VQSRTFLDIGFHKNILNLRTSNDSRYALIGGP